MLRVIGGTTVLACVAACIAFVPVFGARVRLRLAQRRLKRAHAAYLREQRRAKELAAQRAESIAELEEVLRQDGQGLTFLTTSAREAVEQIVRDYHNERKAQ